MAKLSKVLGNLPRAKDLYEEALGIRQEILGKNHPDYGESLKNLAGVYYRMGAHDMADSLYKKAKEAREENS